MKLPPVLASAACNTQISAGNKVVLYNYVATTHLRFLPTIYCAFYSFVLDLNTQTCTCCGFCWCHRMPNIIRAYCVGATCRLLQATVRHHCIGRELYRVGVQISKFVWITGCAFSLSHTNCQTLVR